MHKQVKKAVFPVGGLGTRFLPATKSIPKEMLPVASKPLIQYAFEEAVAAGIEQFIFVTGRNKNAISNHFDFEYELQSVLSGQQKKETLEQVTGWLPPAGQVAFVRQREPLGLGHAVWCARNFIGDEPFAILLADELYKAENAVLAQMKSAYEQSGGKNIIAISEVERSETKKYGIITPDGDIAGDLVKIKDMVEKPDPEVAPSNFAITGRYILNPEIFSYLDEQKKGSGGEIQLTDAMAKMLADQGFCGKLFDGERFDCGSRVGFLEANIAYALEHPDMKDNVKKVLKKYI